MFRNAMLPQLTGLALALGTMVGGALITEMIFSYPGLGMAVLTAIQGSDYPLITPDRWMKDFEDAGFKPEVMPGILKGNAVRLLKLEA